MVDTYGTSKTSMPVERIPGEKMYIDWVGDQPELLLDTTTGELRKVHIFTTTLGFSSLVYAEIFPDEKLPHFITGTVHALSYYGAVPKYLVPDNLRTAVTRHSKDKLVLQSAFSDLETFYDTIVLPPPPRKPKGKPTVENHVRFLETHLVEELKKDTYISLEALNAAVKKIVADINQRPFQKKSDIRKSRMNGFEKYDKPRMNQLPGESYTLCDYIQMTRIRLCNERERDGARVSWILIPISAGGNLQAYFVVMESREFLDYYDEYSIRIAYLLLQAIYEQIVIAQSIGNMGIENLVLLAMHSTGEDEERLLYQASQQGISMNTRYACILFHQKNEQISARDKREMYITVFQSSSISKNSKIAFLDENAGVILAEIRESEKHKKEDIQERILDFYNKITEKCPDMELEFAVLREGKKLSQLKEALEKCGKIMKMGKKLYPERKIWDYETIGPFTWLQIPDEELDKMLLEYRNLMKDEKNIELLRTLKIYLENNMNFSVTAEKMYVHINTIRKRIDKLNTILQIEWDSYMSRLKLEILLQFLEL